MWSRRWPACRAISCSTAKSWRWTTKAGRRFNCCKTMSDARWRFTFTPSICCIATARICGGSRSTQRRAALQSFAARNRGSDPPVAFAGGARGSGARCGARTRPGGRGRETRRLRLRSGRALGRVDQAARGTRRRNLSSAVMCRGSRGFDSLLVGVYEKKRLVFVAKVKDGFVPRMRDEIFRELRKSPERQVSVR